MTIAPIEIDYSLETAKCFSSPAYFIENYVRIFDADSGEWIPFDLWDEQRGTLDVIDTNQLTIALKARQLGMTWLVLAYGLWLMMFSPIAEVLIFSRRETEAVYLLSDERLRGMYTRLPDWMRAELTEEVVSAKRWKLSNGSIARAFPTSAGDSYTATLAIVDEADLAENLDTLMGASKPTIDAGGKMILLSRSNKSKPQSLFKKIYRKAKQKANAWTPVFLPWWVRPSRSRHWYEKQCTDSLENYGALDYVHEHYPGADTEALAPRSLDKRIPSKWLRACYEELDPLRDVPDDCPVIPGLEIYKLPEEGRQYILSGDPAEGNPTSDPSAGTVMDVLTGEEMAAIEGQIQPTVFAGYLDQIGQYYNNADIMCERNNHGHAVIAWLLDYSQLNVLEGWDAAPGSSRKKHGWLSNSKGKALMYNDCADTFRDGNALLHSIGTYTQLASIEGATLLAPAGEHDDRADGYALCVTGAALAANNWLLG